MAAYNWGKCARGSRMSGEDQDLDRLLFWGGRFQEGRYLPQNYPMCHL